MLSKLGYDNVYEAFDGREAVRIMKHIVEPSVETHLRHIYRKNHLHAREARKPVDVILMDLWMPEMDGYEATEKIFDMFKYRSTAEESSIPAALPTVIAVSADVTEKAIARATAVGMEGFMTKPYKLLDLQRLIVEICNRIEGRQPFP